MMMTHWGNCHCDLVLYKYNWIELTQKKHLTKNVRCLPRIDKKQKKYKVNKVCWSNFIALQIKKNCPLSCKGEKRAEAQKFYHYKTLGVLMTD